MMVWRTHVTSVRATGQRWWISARVLAVDGSVGIVRVFDVSTLATRLAHPTRVIIFVIHIVTVVTVIRVLHAIHTLVAHSAIVIPSEARAATCATSRTLVVSGESVTTRKASATFVANMWSFARVQFGVAFEIVQSSETGLTSLANIWFFLAVRKQMTFEVVVTREIRRTIRTLVPLGRRRGSRLTFGGRLCCYGCRARVCKRFM